MLEPRLTSTRLAIIALVLAAAALAGCDEGGEGEPDSGSPECGDREICWNDIDDDCDGEQDEGCYAVACELFETRPCGGSPEVDVCVETCEGNEWGPCEPTGSGAEECGNLLDDNCDGRIDEGC